MKQPNDLYHIQRSFWHANHGKNSCKSTITLIYFEKWILELIPVFAPFSPHQINRLSSQVPIVQPMAKEWP